MGDIPIRLHIVYGGGVLLLLKGVGLDALSSDQLAKAAGCPK